VGGSLSGVATSEGASSQLHRPVWRTGFCKKKWESFWFQVGSAVCRCVVTSCERRVVKSHFCNRVVSKWCAGALACTKNKYKLWVKGSMLPTSKRIHKAILYHIPCLFHPQHVAWLMLKLKFLKYIYIFILNIYIYIIYI
jgi:hypothetical protein